MSDSKMSPLGLRMAALRAFSFPLTAAPVVIATAIVASPSKWDWPVFVASLLGAVFLHGAGNLFNDYFDFRSGVDRRVDGDENRPGRFLVKGMLKPATIMREALLFLLLGLIAGGYVLYRTGPELLYFGAAAVIGLYVYTGPPLRLKYHALGELNIFVVFGPLLMAGAAYAQLAATSSLSFEQIFLSNSDMWLQLVLISIPVGMVTTNVLIGNNLRDEEEDREGGSTTLVHVVGAKVVRVLYIAFLILPPLFIATLAILKIIPMLSLLALVAFLPAMGLIGKIKNGERVPDIDARTAQYCVVFMVMTGLGQFFG